MFTGIIETIGKIKSYDFPKLTIESALSKKLSIGESISVNGVCLTVTDFSKKKFTVDIANETVQCTTFKSLKKNDYVNLERALKVGMRVSGHFVSGHVDGMGKIMDKWTISFPVQFRPYMIKKGSVAINGISLTIQTILKNSISVAIIPHTLKHTTCRYLKIGDPVNIELDQTAKYIENFMNYGRK